MNFRSVYDDVRVRVSRSFDVLKDKSNEDYVFHRAKQQFKDECDINKIVARYPDLNSESYQRQVAGILATNPELFSEYDSAMDYASAVSIVDRAREQFETLPATLRERFSQDPFEFLNYVNNENNRSEAIKLGLLKENIPITNIPVDKPIITEQPVIQAGSVIQPTQEAVTQMSQSSAPMP